MGGLTFSRFGSGSPLYVCEEICVGEGTPG